MPWIRAFKADHLRAVTAEPGLNELLDEYADLFDTSKLGTIRGQRAHFYFKPDAEFRINKPRPVPLAIKPRVESELQCLVNLGVLTPIDKAEYSTTPLVAVLNPIGAVRICGDFKVSLNPHLNAQRTRYQLSPRCCRQPLEANDFLRSTSPTRTCKWSSTRSRGSK